MSFAISTSKLRPCGCREERRVHEPSSSTPKPSPFSGGSLAAVARTSTCSSAPTVAVGDQANRFGLWNVRWRAGLDPEGTFYALRHSYISRAIEAGMPLNVLAENCGTSVRMIEKTYAKVLANKRREFIASGSPRLFAASDSPS